MCNEDVNGFWLQYVDADKFVMKASELTAIYDEAGQIIADNPSLWPSVCSLTEAIANGAREGNCHDRKTLRADA